MMSLRKGKERKNSHNEVAAATTKKFNLKSALNITAVFMYRYSKENHFNGMRASEKPCKKKLLIMDAF